MLAYPWQLKGGRGRSALLFTLDLICHVNISAHPSAAALTGSTPPPDPARFHFFHLNREQALGYTVVTQRLGATSVVVVDAGRGRSSPETQTACLPHANAMFNILGTDVSHMQRFIQVSPINHAAVGARRSCKLGEIETLRFLVFLFPFRVGTPMRWLTSVREPGHAFSQDNADASPTTSLTA